MIPRSMKTLIEPPAGLDIDFTKPKGAEALVPYEGVSWRIFANPVSVFIGGIAAVILELAEDSVRNGVWDHSSFRKDPVTRLRRTGFAALITVYAPREDAENMIARVVNMHKHVEGINDEGLPYRANDPRLLTWVHATALWGFTESYHRYVAPLSHSEKDLAFSEGQTAARLYGADTPPQNWKEWETLLAQTRLEDSPVLAEFLELMVTAPILPRPLRFMQGLLVRAAVAIQPAHIRAFPTLKHYRFKLAEAGIVRRIGRLANAIPLKDLPPAQAVKRFS